MTEVNKGILFSFAAYMCLAAQDAVMKWFVADFSVAELLFWRSLSMVIVCLIIGGKTMVMNTLDSPVLKPLLWRSFIAAMAWVFYYLSAITLSLAQMTTLYYSAPIIVVALAVVLLKEQPTRMQWAAVAIGFVGVLIASRPGFTDQTLAVGYALFSALLWAYTYILLRRLSGKVSVLIQMFAANSMFVATTGASLPWTFTAWDTSTIVLMLLIGLIGGLGQYFLFASFERVEASTLAPIEYSGLIWAFLLSFFIWGDTPDSFLVFGAILIAFSGIISVIANRRKTRMLACNAGS